MSLWGTRHLALVSSSSWRENLTLGKDFIIYHEKCIYLFRIPCYLLFISRTSLLKTFSLPGSGGRHIGFFDESKDFTQQLDLSRISKK